MRRALVAVALLAAAADACAPAAAAPGIRTVAVRIHHSAFEPNVILVRPGETVRFAISNADPIDHEFIVGDRSLQFAHERGTEAFHPPRPGEVTVPAGETVRTTYTFGTEELIFGCHLPGHYAYGMRGVVIVA